MVIAGGIFGRIVFRMKRADLSGTFGFLILIIS
jgi:hypothetical protein